MKTITLAEFLALLEDGNAAWPPILIGQYVYALRVTVDPANPSSTRILVRALLP